MSTKLTRQYLNRMAGSQVYWRGVDYATEGRVRSIRLEGNILRGTVRGSELYHTSLQVVPPFDYHCNCPYDGFCKHLVGLGYAWLQRADEPEAAAAADPILEQLAPLDADDLRGLVVKLVGAVSGAREVVDQFLLQKKVRTLGQDPVQARADADVVRKALRAILSDDLREYDDDDPYYEYDEEFDDWESSGLEDDDFGRLAAVDGQVDALIGEVESRTLPESLPFRALALSGCARELAEAGDRLGEVAWRWSGQINRVVAQVLELVGDPDCPEQTVREALMNLLEPYINVSSRVATLLKPGLTTAAGSQHRDWLLANLEKRRKRASGLRLQRIYELAGEIHRMAGDLGLAMDSMKKAGVSAEIWLEMASTCQESGDVLRAVEAARLALAAASGWLTEDVRRQAVQILLAAGDREGVRTILMERFEASPSMSTAREVLDTAESPLERQHLAVQLAFRIGKSDDTTLRIRLHLEAGRPEEALRVLQGTPGHGPELQAEVASGLAAYDVERAVSLWSKAVTQFIGRRNRTGYGQAAKALAEMRSALHKCGREAVWRDYYLDLLVRYDRYRALKEELAKAGL